MQHIAFRPKLATHGKREGRKVDSRGAESK